MAERSPSMKRGPRAKAARGAVAAGIAATAAGGRGIEALVRHLVPFVPPGALMDLDLPIVIGSFATSLLLALVAGFYPAARAAFVSPTRALRQAA